MKQNTFLKNRQYVACLPDEIEDKPLGRKICNIAMTFFRDMEGQISAPEDFCPHCGAPLSLGFVCDRQLSCGYHELTLNGDGKCAAMVGQRVNRFLAARHYPAIERHGFIWGWPGDATKADPAGIPSLDWAHDPNLAYGGDLYHVECNYRLMIDNLMDLTHETYAHTTSIG